MDRIEQLKLSNEVSMKVLNNDFPINGKAVITINMKNNKAESIEVKNTSSKK